MDHRLPCLAICHWFFNWIKCMNTWFLSPIDEWTFATLLRARFTHAVPAAKGSTHSSYTSIHTYMHRDDHAAQMRGCLLLCTEYILLCKGREREWIYSVVIVVNVSPEYVGGAILSTVLSYPNRHSYRQHGATREDSSNSEIYNQSWLIGICHKILSVSPSKLEASMLHLT